MNVGPPGWLSSTFASQSMNQIVALVDQYGPIFQVNSGFLQSKTVVVCDPDMAATVLINEEAFLPKPHYQMSCWNEVSVFEHL